MEQRTILGPPGTGKTMYIEQYVRDKPSTDYLYLTYNVSMAEFARQRIENDRHKIGTIHSIMAQKNGLGQYLRYEDVVEFAKSTGLTYLKGYDGEGTGLERFLKWYDSTVNLMETPKQPPDESLNMPYLYDLYEKWKERQGKIDYTDILKEAAEHKYFTETLYVDEAQDLSSLMWKIIDNIECDMRIIVGDPHQSINGFRGVRVQDFFQRIHNPLVLDKSHRYGENVRLLSDSILGSAKLYDARYTALGQSDIDRYSLTQFGILQGSKAILCRTNALASLLAHKLPWAIEPISKEHAYGNGWNEQTFRLAAILAQFPNVTPDEFRYLVDHSPADLWVRGTKSRVKKEITLFSYDLMSEKIGIKEIAMRLQVKENVKGNLIKLLMDPDMPRVKVDTIHASKGLEYDHILLMLDFPAKLRITDEERRLFYVAATRARKSIDFWYMGYYNSMFMIPGHAKVLSNGLFS